MEAISIPFVAARRWLAQTNRVLADTADLEVQNEPQDDGAAGRGGRRAFCWRGDASEIVEAFTIRPGDTLVVPSSYGGIDPASKCFDPNAKTKVPDLAERASLMARGQPRLRLHPEVLNGLELTLDRDDVAAARRGLASLAGSTDGWKRLWARRLGAGWITRTVPWGDEGTDGWSVLSGERVTARELRDALYANERDQASIEDGVWSTTDDEDSSYVGSEVELDVHSRDVEERARNYAMRLGLSHQLTTDLSLAAWLHDIGKADLRFQRMLRGGSEITYYRDEGRILAKSRMMAGSKGEHRRAQEQSGYPRGARHEVQSLAMIEAAREQVTVRAHDVDLVMYLVGSHHGYCRPFAPPIEDLEPVGVSLDAHKSETFGTFTFRSITSANGLHRLDSPLADRFWSLIARYGWLELCWLEAILRLADHRASEDEAGDRE
jgi:CRISPR-associated endonuclease/helicase Cas3